MINLIKRKGLLTLMAVVFIVAIMSVACKKKVTQPSLSAEAGTEEVISGAEDTTDNKDATNSNGYKVTFKFPEIGIYFTATASPTASYFEATVKHPEIRIEYKDFLGGQCSLVIKSEGKSPIKTKNSIFGFNFIIDGVTLLATHATPNYDASGKLVSIVFSSKYTGRTREVKF